MQSSLAPPPEHRSGPVLGPVSPKTSSQLQDTRQSNRATDVGDRLYAALESSVVLETSGWAVERVERVAARLQRTRPLSQRLQVAVPWIEAFTAFTAPGRYIYVSRRLLELCRHDEATAFVIAHEIAHHDLGHLDFLARWLPRVIGTGTARLLTVLYRCMEGALFSSQKESDADRRAVDLCLEAGYDVRKCLVIFDVLEKFALDMGDIDAALGSDDLEEQRRNTPLWQSRLKSVWYKIRRGYPSISERRAQLKCHLAGKSGPQPAGESALTAAQIALVRPHGRFPDWF
jgi:predicted Zn-dependent protease